MIPNMASRGEMKSEEGLSTATIAYVSILFTLLIMSFVILCIKMSSIGQKTRNTQQRRVYVGTRARPSLGQAEPTIYVSPSNLPPPPKYECMAPPSYEEVVGVHYPSFPAQPITQPITTALAQNTTSNPTPAQNNEENRNNDTTPETVITVTTEDTRPSVTVARS